MVAAQQGDSQAYERLLRDILPALRGYAKRRLRDDASVEDVTQEVLLSLHRARHTYRAERPFEPWMWAIARNAVTDVHRTRSRRASRETPLPEGDELHDLLAGAGSASASDPERRARARRCSPCRSPGFCAAARFRHRSSSRAPCIVSRVCEATGPAALATIH